MRPGPDSTGWPSEMIVAELAEFVKFARANPDSKIHVKRWNKTLRTYDCGLVLVKDGKVLPTVYIMAEKGPPSKFSFDGVEEMIHAGWIGD